jgi:hypothetical protein
MSIFTVIRQELDAFPGTYDALSAQEVADELNVLNKVQNRSSMTGREILNEIETTALATLTGDNAVKVMGLLGSDDIDPFGPGVQIMVDAFGGGSTTITNLQIARTETVSRAAQLGLGTVSEGDVITARAI